MRKYTWGLDLSGQSGNGSVEGIHGAGGIGGPLAVEIPQTTGESKKYWYMYDANGNVGQLVRYQNTGGETATLAAHYDYDAYGRTLRAVDFDSGNPIAAANPFRFSTKWLDDQTSANGFLYYYGFRFYSPRLGRWISRDPIEEDDGPSLYAFASNQAPNWVDVLGQNAMVWPPPPILRPPHRPEVPPVVGPAPPAGTDCGVNVNRTPLCSDHLKFGCNLGHTWINLPGGSNTVDFPPDYIEKPGHKCQNDAKFIEKTWKTKTTPGNKRSCADINTCLLVVEEWWAKKEDFSILDRSCRDFAKEALSVCGLERGILQLNEEAAKAYCCHKCSKMATDAKYTHPR